MSPVIVVVVDIVWFPVQGLHELFLCVFQHMGGLEEQEEQEIEQEGERPAMEQRNHLKMQLLALEHVNQLHLLLESCYDNIKYFPLPC